MCRGGRSALFNVIKFIICRRILRNFIAARFAVCADLKHHCRIYNNIHSSTVPPKQLTQKKKADILKAAQMKQEGKK